MKIRRIEIQGFKSFADRMVFEFDAGITAIVGPNGCGKSNVVDALKWVLGDMSPRSLRGKKMEDVIFAGSRHRKPLGMAEVTLVLDNEDGLLPTELTEVSLTRRLHRSGESEYLINRESARLKDIRELFLDTGVGTEGNAIMEQGQIDALLAANPQDRRGIFEEAAGVSRYKQRRKEADQRLQRTQENLARLRDVLDLEEKRLRSLKSQAAKARRYQELREELAARRVQRAVVRYHEVAGERDALAAQLNAVGEREASAAEELAGLEQATDSHEAELVAARERVRELEAAIASAASDVRAARDRVAYAQRDAEQLVERRALLARQTEADGARRETLAGEITSLETAADEARGRMDVDADRVRSAEADLVELDREAATIRDAHDGAKREALDALGRLGELRNDEATHRTEARQAEERRRRLEEQRAEMLVRAGRVEAEARELLALTASLDEAARQQAASLEAAEEARAVALGRADAAKRRRAGAAERRASASARLDVLARMAAAREGTDAGARRILAALEQIEPDADGARDGLFGLVADCVAPAAELAAELDLRLGQAAGALLARSTADAVRWLAWLREHGEGEAARFLCLDLRPRAPQHDDLPEAARLGCDGELAELVRGVLARTALVADLPAALEAVRVQGRHAVTSTGDRVTDSGAVLGGRTAVVLGLVERGAEIRSLRQQIAAFETEHHDASNDAQAAELAVGEADEQIRRLRRELQQRSEDRQRRGEALARVERERALQAETIEVLAAEVAELAGAAREAEGLRAEKARAAEVLEAERATLEERAEEAARGYAAVEARRREAGERRMNLLLALAETKAKSEAAARRVVRVREEIAALDERLAGHAREREVLDRRLAEAEVEATEAESLAKTRESARGVAGEELVKARATLTDLERVAHAAVARRREVQALHERLRDELSGFRAREAELRARVEVLLDQVRQDHGLDLAEVARATELGEALDVAAMTEEVESLQRRLEALGNVNLNALDELAEVEAHVNGLKEQEHDLITASGDLGQAIQELDRITTERFGATFEQIRENFRNTFRRLFGGGRADVMLEDASNLLESGIEIVARPPGKEQRTISLLSGGERTLTATALLFAVFQAKPSPFALLDEVDAALDEANVRRLLGLVREFTDRCQFIIITHAKSTMEAADLLYGVTMEEPGVSKKVAVRLTEYAQAPTPAAAAG
ncbi:MAG: chromosome segregation protein SMC [Planctomycetota bacterium]